MRCAEYMDEPTEAWKSYLPKLYTGTKPADFTKYRQVAIAAIERPGYASTFSPTTRTRHGAVEAAPAAVHAPTLVVIGEMDPDFKDTQGEARWIAHQLHGAVLMVREPGTTRSPSAANSSDRSSPSAEWTHCCV